MSFMEKFPKLKKVLVSFLAVSSIGTIASVSASANESASSEGSGHSVVEMSKDAMVKELNEMIRIQLCEISDFRETVNNKTSGAGSYPHWHSKRKAADEVLKKLSDIEKELNELKTEIDTLSKGGMTDNDFKSYKEKIHNAKINFDQIRKYYFERIHPKFYP